MCTRELYNMGITSTKEEAGLASGGKGWFPLVSGEEGLVSAGFRVGRTGFGWFRVGRTGFVWEGLVSGGFGSFRFLVTTRPIIHLTTFLGSSGTGHGPFCLVFSCSLILASMHAHSTSSY